MNLVYPTHRFDQLSDVEEAFDKLQERPRYGLAHAVTRVERAPRGCFIHHQRVDYWVTAEGKRIPIRVEIAPSRPKREYVRKLIGPDGIPTLLVYAKIGLHALVRKVAKCIKLGLNKLRYADNKRMWMTRNPKIANLVFTPVGPKWNPYKSENTQLDRIECYA